MLQKLEVLVFEFLARCLETIDLLELLLLLLKRLANDVTGLGIRLVADALGVLLRLVHDGLGGLLGSDKRRRDLALGRIEARLRGSRRSGSGTGGKLCLGLGELLLGCGETVLQVDDLVQHSIDLSGQLLEEHVNLAGIIAALRLREGLGLDVCRCDSHLETPFRRLGRAPMQAGHAFRQVYL